jgi:putative resolvase
MARLVPIKEASAILGVSVDTLRRWEKEGKITSQRTDGGHRRYDVSSLVQTSAKILPTVCYARVSSHDQKDDLVRQSAVLEAWCKQHGYEAIILKDLGSGLNYKKRGLKTLLLLITQKEVSRLVVTHKDRLLRFGSELIFSLCEQFGVEVVILNRTDDSSFEEDLAKDVLEIITVFSARLYGSRSRKNQKILEKLAQTLDETLYNQEDTEH